MRIFLAGATGYLGKAITSTLIAAGHQVTALVRGARNVDPAARTLRGDLTDPASFAEVGRDHDVLIHVASLSGPDRPAQDRRAIETLVETARRAREPRAVIYTSGVWVLGHGAADESTVTDHPAAVSAFRAQLERDLVAASDDTVAVAVLRPGIVYGGDEGAGAWLARWLPEESGHEGSIVYIDGDVRWSVVHLDDVASFYRRVVERRASGVLHAVEPEPIRVVEAARRLAEVAGRPLFVWPRADAAAKLGAGLAEALTLDQVVSGPRAAEVLGWKPARPPFMEAIESTWRELIRPA